jgi:hypothetical protein
MKRLVFVLLGAVVAACSAGGGEGGMPEIHSFSATPTNLPVGGGSVQLQWDVSGATSLSISGDVGSVSPSDVGGKTLSVGASRTFTLTATNTAGSVTADASVMVALAPSISVSPPSRTFLAGSPGGTFDANVQGSSATVTWTLSGPGALGSDTGPSVIYTPPATVTGPTTATVTASLSGTDLTASASLSIVPAVLVGGVLFYKSDGSGTLGRLDAQGAFHFVRDFAAGELPAGVTHVGKPYELYELLYNATDGSGALGTFDGLGAFRRLEAYASGELPQEQTQMVSLNDRLVFRKGGTTLCGSYDEQYAFTEPTTQTGFAPDWDLVQRVNASASGVFFYRKRDGTGGYGTYDASCRWSFVRSFSGLTWNWSHIVSARQGVLFYRQSDGVGATVTFAADGTPSQLPTGSYPAGTLGKDWEQVVSAAGGVLFYKSDGSGELGTFDTAHRYSRVKSFAAGELPAGAALVAPVGQAGGPG